VEADGIDLALESTSWKWCNISRQEAFCGVVSQQSIYFEVYTVNQWCCSALGWKCDLS